MIGKNIKCFREAKGFSQEQMAERLNVTRQAVSNWECGKTQPNIDMLHNISGILEISIEELIYGTKQEKTVVHHHTHQHIDKHVNRGIGFGAVLAVVISYVRWKSIGWAILHGALNWGYVIYSIIKYGWS